MTESITHNTDANDLLIQVREGMDVYDRDGRKVGSVKDIYVGEAVDGPPGVEPARGSEPLAPGTGGLVNSIARAFDTNLPEVLRSRLHHNGYVQISTGLLRSDRYALREQVATVDAQRVTLNVLGEALIKP